MQHLVTQLPPPHITSSGVAIHLVPMWRDNLVWLLVKDGKAAAVDGPEAGPALELCTKLGVTLTTIINTHTHPDHIGINLELQKRGLLETMSVYGAASRRDDIPGLTHPVKDGETHAFFGSQLQAMLTEGHIDGHISYVFDDALFCGDTLFGAGCGYLFDGPPEKMHKSLQRLATLPQDTKVFCAHEYTEDNLKFALSVDPKNDALQKRMVSTQACRQKGECSIPSTIAMELRTNPFIRCEETSIQLALKAAGLFPDSPQAANLFAATRALKDRKDYKRTDPASA